MRRFRRTVSRSSYIVRMDLRFCPLAGGGLPGLLEALRMVGGIWHRSFER